MLTSSTFISHNRQITIRSLYAIIIMVCILWLPIPNMSNTQRNQTAYAQTNDRFRDFEIRVIRPKFFIKSMRFEVAAQLGAIFNHAFIYTYNASLTTTFHLNEFLAFEANGNWGLSLERQAKINLKNTFQINTIIHRTQHILTGALVWTPVYGKFQTFSKNLIYFDIFFAGGGGITGIDYQYDHCQRSTQSSQTISQSQVVNYPTLFPALGGKIFLNKNTALRTDLSWLFYYPVKAYEQCSTKAQQSALAQKPKFDWMGYKDNWLFKIGISRFF